MSEAADELERMAARFEAFKVSANIEFHESMSASEQLYVALSRVCAGAWHEAVDLLRERAAELRQQRSGPTYEPQPKPAEAKAGQWWMRMFGDQPGNPGRIVSVHGDSAVHHTQDGYVWGSQTSCLLSDPNYAYLGDGPEPQNA